MGSYGREEVFMKILIFIAVVTAFTGIVNLANSGSVSLGNFGGGTIPGQTTTGNGLGYIEGSNSAQGTVVTDLDFTTASSLNSNISTEIGGPWTLTYGTGLVLSGLPIGSGIINPSAVIVRNGMINGQTYTTNAKVQNPSGSDFYVFPRFIDGYSGSDLKVVFSFDGVHVKKFPLYLGLFDNGDDYFFPLPGAETTIQGGSTITTELIETVSSQISNTPDYTSTLTVSKDGAPLFSTSVRSILAGANINDQVRHGGAGADTTGFIVMGFPNTPILDNSSVIISGSTGSAADKAAPNFLSVIATILGLTPDPLIPFWLWAAIFIPCISTLALIYFQMVRGN